MKINMKNILTLLVVIILTMPKIGAQIVIPVNPKMEVETSTNGQIAIRGYSGPIGTSVPPPTNPGNIGVLGVGFSGVKGEAKAEFGHGVWGTTSKENSNGVYGVSTAGDYSYGINGYATGGFGSAGLYAKYEGSSIGYGVHGVAIGTNVRGVFGVVSNGSTGHSGYFAGGSGVYVSPRLGVQQTNPLYPIHVGSNSNNGNGAHVTGGGTWTNGSSRTFKEDFKEIDPQEVLDKISNLSINQWKYKGSDEGAHLGPVAEDFYLAFGLGDDDHYISTVDADGVALAAIQALNDKMKSQEQMIQQLIQENQNQSDIIVTLTQQMPQSKKVRKSRKSK